MDEGGTTAVDDEVGEVTAGSWSADSNSWLLMVQGARAGLGLINPATARKLLKN